MSLDTMFCITDKIRITKLQFPSVNRSFEHHLLKKIISIPKYVNENSNIYLKMMKITFCHIFEILSEINCLIDSWDKNIITHAHKSREKTNEF